MSAVGELTAEINAHMVKVRVIYANVGHLRCRCDVSLAVKGRIYDDSET